MLNDEYQTILRTNSLFTSLGDSKLDIIIDKEYKGAVVTIVDRKSKFMLAKPVKRRWFYKSLFNYQNFTLNISIP